ncbi:GNAT family N-acetyltransferase [Spiribacter vilamensis]|uniref:Acetyltransferase (GNAT) family protein n=1 Tax=Spiribacter vilamensis TaxID=531306 RepID=A0A4Q8CZB7_9GAMM|nr:GNAT family N-acetyltransferase [Spiribacter vilamensis]RZU98368.1 acetyltransferase (GNAT) family protein [Spiribacter vilamensis]TVO60750.1 GNAT family N-acetyltransferase [Spiribacter vilamensis]
MQIRKAVLSDQAALMAIASQAFPTSFRWQLPPLSAIYWHSAVAAAKECGAETWVATVNEEVVGGLVLVVDEARWSQRQKSPPYPAVCYLRCIAYTPSAIRVIRRRIAACRTGISGSKEVPDLKMVVPLEERLSTDLGMVRPDFQGQGIARAFRRHAESRCRSLGRRYMRTMTAVENVAMRHLLVSMQYKVMQTRDGMCVYVKDIEAT